MFIVILLYKFCMLCVIGGKILFFIPISDLIILYILDIFLIFNLISKKKIHCLYVCVYFNLMNYLFQCHYLDRLRF
jgi:hypothetical protein